jgi:Ca2+-binding RTX toxin-like protein
VLATSAGNISVVWTSGTTIYAQLLSTTGEPLADSVVVSTSASPHWTVNQIALPNGGIFINWRGADGSGEGAEARVLDAQGQIVSDELIINDVTSGYQYGDQAAVNSAGIVLSTFVADDGSGFGVFAQKLQIGGASTVPINTAPTDISIATPIVPENAPAGTVVGTLTATDANAGDTHTFELTSDPSGFFEIVGNQVRVKSGAAIDYETATSHQIEVKATDFGGLATSKTFVLGISDVPGVAQVGGAGNDYLVGTPENDTLDGGIGADIMDGGEGDDVFIVDDPADIVVAGYSLSLPNNTQLFFAQGYDTVYTSVSYNTSIGIEKVVLTGTAPIDVTGFARIRNPLVVGSLKEHFIGNDAANRLSGVDDDDILEGGGGNDTLIGGEGADKLDGGAGNDTVDYSTAVSGLTVSLAHVDRNTGDAAGDTYVSIERLVGSSYANVLYGNRWTATEIDGGAGDDRVFGFGDSDILLGNVGTDRLYGGHGGDILIGGQDFDILYGEGGDDLLDGVDGETVKVADHLVGGLGDDVEPALRGDRLVATGLRGSQFGGLCLQRQPEVGVVQPCQKLSRHHLLPDVNLAADDLAADAKPQIALKTGANDPGVVPRLPAALEHNGHHLNRLGRIGRPGGFRLRHAARQEPSGGQGEHSDGRARGTGVAANRGVGCTHDRPSLALKPPKAGGN